MFGKDFCKHKVIEETTKERTDNVRIKHNNTKSKIYNSKFKANFQTEKNIWNMHDIFSTLKNQQ